MPPSPLHGGKDRCGCPRRRASVARLPWLAAGWVFGYRRRFRGEGFSPFVGLDGLRAAGGGDKRFSPFSGAKRE